MSSLCSKCCALLNCHLSWFTEAFEVGHVWFCASAHSDVVHWHLSIQHSLLSVFSISWEACRHAHCPYFLLSFSLGLVWLIHSASYSVILFVGLCMGMWLLCMCLRAHEGKASMQAQSGLHSESRLCWHIVLFLLHVFIVRSWECSFLILLDVISFLCRNG